MQTGQVASTPPRGYGWRISLLFKVCAAEVANILST